MYRRSGTISSIAFALCLFTFGCGAVQAEQTDPANSIVGGASVIDGDTIEIRGTRIRLSGFDTPERGSMCGTTNAYQQAALALSDFIGRKNVECAVSGTDQYSRTIATCFVQGTDLGTFMVESGWGRDWRRYSGGKYAPAERAARSGNRGLWGLDCPDDLWGTRNYD